MHKTVNGHLGHETATLDIWATRLTWGGRLGHEPKPNTKTVVASPVPLCYRYRCVNELGS